MGQPPQPGLQSGQGSWADPCLKLHANLRVQGERDLYAAPAGAPGKTPVAQLLSAAVPPFFKHPTIPLFLLLHLSCMEKITKKFCPISGKVSN